MASRLVTVSSFLLAIPFLAALCSSFSTDYPSDRRILVLLDDLALKSSHSLFFNSLHTRGFDLDYRLADDRNLALQRYGQYSYDALIIFAPYTESFGGSINPAAILDFVDSGHDLIIAADVSASDLIREVATECGVEFDEDPEAVVIDHTSYAVSEIEGDHTLIASDNFIQSDVMLGSKKIEGDNVGAINAIRNGDVGMGLASVLVADTLNLMEKCSSVECSFIKREGNKAAHLFANHASSLDDCVIWLEDPPVWAQNVILNDSLT